jgi:hypothetical protein
MHPRMREFTRGFSVLAALSILAIAPAIAAVSALPERKIRFVNAFVRLDIGAAKAFTLIR